MAGTVPSIREILIAEIASEESGTRRTLERVPQDRWDWAPHEKSMPMGRLASWVAQMLGEIPGVLTSDGWDTAAPGNANRLTAADLTSVFEKAADSAKAALEAAPDSVMSEPWSLRHGANILWGPVPKYAVVRGFFLSDLIHHRAQLGVYLRLSGIAVPAVYGPSADEAG